MKLFKKKEAPVSQTVEKVDEKAELKMKKDEATKEKKRGIRQSFQTKAFKMGGYSFLITAIVVALVVVVNIVVNALPANLTKFDTTSEGLFSISGQTQELVSNLDEDVNIYFIAENGNEMSVIKEMIDKYADLSKHIKVKQIDPALNPNFTSKYTENSLSSNSIIVESDRRFRVIDANEIILTETDYSNYYTTGQATTEYSFNGESALTGAIDYVSSESIPIVYALSGHGESELSDTMSGYVQADNIELKDLSLVSQDSVPEDADAIMICAPTSDISSEEAQKIMDYLEDGGKLMLLTSYAYDSDTKEETEMPNLMKVTQTYGCTLESGYLTEMNTGNYYQSPYYLLPNIGSHDITEPLLENGSRVIAPIAQGIKVSDSIRSSVKITHLLTTSDSAYSKQDIMAQTYEKEEGDIDGPFDLAVAIEESYNDVNTRIVWFSCAYMLQDEMDEAVSGGNSDMFRNALAWLVDKEDSISIRAKSLSAQALVVDEASANTWMIITIAVVPLVIIAAGFVIWLRRRKL